MIWAVIPAAGRGSRFGGETPKQYLEIAGRPLIAHALDTLLAHPQVAGAIVALSKDDALWPGWTAMHGKPMVVLYKLSPATYRLGKGLAIVDMYAMVNLIAGRRIVVELIQDDCTPEAVTREAVRILTDEPYRKEMAAALDDVRRQLGGPGASDRAAQAILEMVPRVP